MKKTIAALAACTLAFAACGDDDESPSDTGDDTETTEADDTETTEGDDTDTTEGDDTDITEGGESDSSIPSGAEDMLDNLRQQMVDLGLSEEQADCVVDNSVELGMESQGGEMPSNDELLSVYEECDVDLGDLGG